MFQNFGLIRTGVDVKPVMEALEKKPHLFDQITARQTTPGSPHRDTKAIFLRWCKEQSVHAAFNELEAIDYPALEELPEARPLIAEIMRAAGSKILGRVLIASLSPGGLIDAHADEGAVADHYERFHLPLKSEPGNWFYSQLPNSKVREVVHMKPGEIWWFNHKRWHELENASQSPRLHLIVDCVAPKFRRERDAISA
jgi:hypothetical protein